MKKTALLFFALVVLLATGALKKYSPTVIKVDQQNNPWVAPASAKEIKNPFAGDKSSVKRGKSIYKMRCVVCHGESGKGDGPGSKALNPKPADHTSKKVQSQTDGEIFWKVSEGRGAMIGWKMVMPEDERWDVVNYLRTLASK